MANDPRKIWLTGITPLILWRPMASRPADAMQPQLRQSGLPPNWHGVTVVVKSDETQCVVFANMHSSGEAGGVS